MYLTSYPKNVIALITKIYEIHAIYRTLWLFNAMHGKATLKPTGFAAYYIDILTWLYKARALSITLAWFVIFKASM